jgi:hypothetical protein
MERSVATAPIAATGLVAGYAVAAGSGSRTLGGLVLAAFGLLCVGIWLVRDGARTAIQLAGIGLVAFAFSHVLGPVIGAWPAVLVCAGATALACWCLSDARARARLGLGLRARIGPRTHS